MSQSVVVDTDVLSFTFKNHTIAQLYEPHLVGKLLVISFMTLAELNRWAIQNNWGQERIRKLEEHLKTNYVVYPYDKALCYTWAEIMSDSQRRGHNIQPSDAWIAATALLHCLPLVTHNRKDFDHIPGLQLISEAPIKS